MEHHVAFSNFFFSPLKHQHLSLAAFPIATGGSFHQQHWQKM